MYIHRENNSLSVMLHIQDDKDVEKKLRKADYTLLFVFLYVFPVAVMSVLSFICPVFMVTKNTWKQNQSE